jgi:hypothetical protein
MELDRWGMDIMYSCIAGKNSSFVGFYHYGDVLTISESVPISYRDTFYVNINGQRMDMKLAPHITSTARIDARAGEVYSYPVSADGAKPMIFKLMQKPLGMFIDSLSGVISWMPADAQIGNNFVIVRVTNSITYDEQAFTIHVAASPPKITSVADSIAVAQTEYSYQITASGRPAPSFQLLAYPAGVSIDTNGKLTWTPQRSQLGPHRIGILASNSVGDDEQTINVTVYTMPELQFIPDLKIKSDTSYQYTAIADAYPLPIFSFDTTPGGMTIGASSGEINWTPTKAQAGNHSVQVRATNPHGNMQRSFTITVDSASRTGIGRIQQPLWFSIGQSYPNPVYVSYGEALVIPITAAKSVRIRARIYDAKGIILQESSEQIIEAGRHELRFDLKHSPSGNYFCLLEEPDGKAYAITFVVVK